MRTHNDGNAKATKIDANHKPITNNQEKTITRPEDVSELIWKDWLRHRKGLRASVTDTVVNKIRKEAGKAGMPLESVFELMCARGWRGFEADWVKKSSPNENFMGRKVL
jgi:hypothetical protein